MLMHLLYCVTTNRRSISSDLLAARHPATRRCSPHWFCSILFFVASSSLFLAPHPSLFRSLVRNILSRHPCNSPLVSPSRKMIRRSACYMHTHPASSRTHMCIARNTIVARVCAILLSAVRFAIDRVNFRSKIITDFEETVYLGSHSRRDSPAR